MVVLLEGSIFRCEMERKGRGFRVAWGRKGALGEGKGLPLVISFDECTESRSLKAAGVKPPHVFSFSGIIFIYPFIHSNPSILFPFQKRKEEEKKKNLYTGIMSNQFTTSASELTS